MGDLSYASQEVQITDETTGVKVGVTDDGSLPVAITGVTGVRIEPADENGNLATIAAGITGPTGIAAQIAKLGFTGGALITTATLSATAIGINGATGLRIEPAHEDGNLAIVATGITGLQTTAISILSGVTGIKAIDVSILDGITGIKSIDTSILSGVTGIQVVESSILVGVTGIKLHTDYIPSPGQTAMAYSMPVVIASNQSVIGITGMVTANQGTPGATTAAWPIKITDGITFAGIDSYSSLYETNIERFKTKGLK